MRIALGCDEAGLPLLNVIREYLATRNVPVQDFGVHTTDPVDYPDVAEEASKAVASGDCDRAILVCGTGIGMSITANKVPGVRAALAYDAYSVERSILSNNCQVLALGARVIGGHLATTIVRQWLALRFDTASPSSAKLAMLAAFENTEHLVSGHRLEDAPAC